MKDLRAHVLAHPPRCLADVLAAPAGLLEDRDMDSVAFRLTPHAGPSLAQVLGHKLSRYNLDYDGGEFISPLSLLWSGASAPAPVFDSDVHGYHGEMESSAKLRGDGPPEAFSCPACGGGVFHVSVQFDYGEACHDLAEDEPDLAVEDYFQNIMVDGLCIGCGKISRVLDMDV